MTRAVFYLRISESDEASTSLQRQEADLRERADREGWNVVAVLSDDGLSGGYRRSNAERALAMLRDGEADLLAVWKSDRWSRMGTRPVADLEDVLEARPGTRFVADKDGLDSKDASFDLMFGVLASVARAERKNTQVRVRSSIAALRRGGRYSGGNLPYGYRPVANPDGPGRVLVVNEEEAAVVREAADRVLAGESVYAVSLDLNARKVPTRRRTTWTVQALRQVLTSDAILGRVTHRKELLRGDDGLPLQVWPPALDLETWTRVRSVLGVGAAAPKRAPRRRRARLLSGLISCGLCGAPLYVRVNGAGHPAYGCSARSNGRPCAGVSISADDVERYVVDGFLSAWGDHEVFEEVVEAGADEAALADVQRALDETAQEMTTDDADVAELGRRMVLLKARRAAIKAAPSDPQVTLTPTGKTYRETWEEADLDGQRAILGDTLAFLTVRKGTRGLRTFDPSRVLLVANPPHVAGVSTEPKPRWSPVV
jgi:site-specific DNA recombinase